MTETELAWAAGFFDGEGNAMLGRPGGYRQVIAHIGQADRRVLDRFQGAVGVGKVYGPRAHKNPRARPMYEWKAWTPTSFHLVMWLLWPWLSEIKRMQFHQASEEYRAWRSPNPHPRGAGKGSDLV